MLPLCPDWVKFHHFGNILKVFGYFFQGLFCIWHLLWQKIFFWANLHCCTKWSKISTQFIPLVTLLGARFFVPLLMSDKLKGICERRRRRCRRLSISKTL